MRALAYVAVLLLLLAAVQGPVRGLQKTDTLCLIGAVPCGKGR